MEHPASESQLRFTLLHVICSVEQSGIQTAGNGINQPITHKVSLLGTTSKRQNETSLSFFEVFVKMVQRIQHLVAGYGSIKEFTAASISAIDRGRQVIETYCSLLAYHKKTPAKEFFWVQ